MLALPSNFALPLPAPRVPVSVRPATADDLPFIDALQKRQSKQVGFMPAATLRGKLALGHVLVAEVGGRLAGYLIGCDRYFKRDDVGVVYQINVAAERAADPAGHALERPGAGNRAAGDGRVDGAAGARAQTSGGEGEERPAAARADDDPLRRAAVFRARAG